MKTLKIAGWIPQLLYNNRHPQMCLFTVNRNLTIWQWWHYWKRPWKKGLCPLKLFCPYTLYQITSYVYMSVEKLDWNWKEGAVSEFTERENKIYHLAVPILKSTQNSVISHRSWAGMAKKCTKSVMHIQSCWFAHKILFVFRCSCCRHQHSFIRSLTVKCKETVYHMIGSILYIVQNWINL